MKRFFLILAMCLWGFLCNAQELPENHGITLDLEETEPQTKLLKFSDMFETVVEVGNYFNTNYPDDKIYTDLKPDIQKFFPNLTTQQLYDRENFIRKSILLFRWSKQKIAEIKSSFLVPDTPVLTYKDDEYENPDDHPYIDVGEDNIQITTDIKKVISYSGNPKEIESYEAFKQRQKDKEKFQKAFPQIEKLQKIYDKIELKKLPFYGIMYKDPTTNGEGITPWQEKKEAAVRLATEQSKLDNNPIIRGIVHFALNQDQVLLAQPYKQYPEIQINFSKSHNIKQCHLFRPTPYRALFDDGDLIVYLHNFAYPFLCEVENPQMPATIKADINYSLCNSDKICYTDNATLSLELQAGMGFDTVMKNFITQAFNHLPDTQEKDVIIRDLSLEKNKNSPTGETLRLIVETKSSLNHPDFFIRTEDNIIFDRPRIAINNNRISARIDVLSPSADLADKPLEITISGDGLHQYRFIKNVTFDSMFSINSQNLSLGLWLLAVLGGFILNFMPCVFPVLFLKILSLTKFGAKNNLTLRQNFRLSICGIFCGFFILASLLSGLKMLGHNLGWGMQFQNPLFIIFMIFAILFFIAQIQGILHLQFSSQKNLFSQRLTPHREAFFSGIFIVIMSTPCTGPYLGTTIGFALAGSPTDIFAILTAIAIGLSLPYFLLLCMPDLSVFVPHPGAWMNKIHGIMNIMLILTLIWLLSILKAQSSWLTLSSIVIMGILFYSGLYIYHFSLLEAEKISHHNKHILHQTRKYLQVLFLCFMLIILSCSFIFGHYGFKHHLAKVEQNSESELDFQHLGQLVDEGYNVIVKVGADWCLTCGYNDMIVFNNPSNHDLFEAYKIKLINIDWTDYNPDILNFMAEYGRRGLPFYILYNRNLPEGLVLPEVLSQMSFDNILRHNGILTLSSPQ